MIHSTICWENGHDELGRVAEFLGSLEASPPDFAGIARRNVAANARQRLARSINKGGSMARRSLSNPLYKVPYRVTDGGAVTDLKGLYAYPDGHFELVLGDGACWPCADGLEAIDHFVYLLTDLRRATKKAHPKPR